MFVFLLFVSGYVYSDSQKGESITYCEDIASSGWRYRHGKDALRALTMKAQRKAVEYLFQNELKHFDSKLDKQEIVNALRNLIEHDDQIDTASKGNPFNACVGINNVRLKDAQDQLRFQPKQIGEVCHFSEQVREEQSDEIARSFVSALQDKNTPKSITSMLNQPDNISPQSEKQLSRYIHKQVSQPNLQKKIQEGTKCISLFVYPVELYTASSPIEISPEITVQPPVESVGKKGNKGEFQIVVIHKDYHWKIGHQDTIMKTGLGQVDDFEDKLLNPNFQKYVNKRLIGIVNIGMASCGGSLKIENERGNARARKLTEWISHSFSRNSNLKVYGLNLGKHKYSGTKCKQLSTKMRDSQRRILLIGITKNSDSEVDIQSALQRAMKSIAVSQPEKLPIKPSDYHLFDLIEN